MMTDKEYLMALRAFKELNITKEKWMTFDDRQRHDLIELMNEVNSYSSTYRRNKKIKVLEKLRDIGPYGEENWDV